MSVPPTKEEVTERERRAWALRTQHGLSHQQIADELGVERSTVTKLLGRMNSRLHKTLEKELEQRKAEQTAQLEHIFAEAIGAWEESKPRAAVTRIDEELSGKGEAVAELIVRGDRSGFLKAAMQALGDARKIWGLDAPAKAELAGKGGAPLTIRVEYANVDDNADAS